MSLLLDYNEEDIYENFSNLKKDLGFEKKKDLFNEALRAVKSKFNTFCKINFNNKNSNIIDCIKERNIHTQYIFKKKNLDKDDDITYNNYIIDELCKNLDDKKTNKNMCDIDNNKEETKDTDNQNWHDVNNKTDNKDYFDSQKNNYSFIDTNISNHEKIEKLEEIIIVKKNIYDISNHNQNSLNLLNRKRNKDISDIKESSYNLVNEIQNLYDNYNKRKKDLQKEYKIYIDDVGFFNKNLTIIEKEAPTCIIYIENKVLEKIYLVREQIFISNEDEIKEVLTIVKQNILKVLK